MDRLLIWFYHRYRPREGWALFILTISILALCVRTVQVTEWVSESDLVWIPFFPTVIICYLIIWRTEVNRAIHLFILATTAIIFPFLAVLRIQPFIWLLRGWTAFATDVQLKWATLSAKVSGWLAAISLGETSSETIVFTFGLAVLVSASISIALWSIYRHQKGLIVLFVLCLLMGLNDYFSGSRNASILLILMLSIICIVLWEQRNKENFWESTGIDYSADMYMVTTLVTAGIALVLLLGGIFLPSLPYSAVARWFQQSSFVQAFEDTFEQLFSGVNTATTGSGGIGSGTGGEGQESNPVGIMPRSYLLGNPPELAETPIFLADISFSQPPSGPQHWRSASFDIYTGRGWRQSQVDEVILVETQETVPQLIPISTSATQVLVEQQITWVADGRFSNLLSLGIPTEFSQPIEAHMRPFGDLSHVRNPSEISPPGYQVLSSLPKRDPSILRPITIGPESFEDPLFYEHYTQIPEDVPERVLALAQQVTAEAETPYDKAVLLEQFLRQYPYNLDIPRFPEGADPVDYFLFDLQEGYCDLYASSMVVMARSVGLPARLGIGFLNPASRPDGQYLITRDLGHSWAEIYFPEIGWVEFEPTATFPISSETDPVAQGQSERLPEVGIPDLPEIPPAPLQNDPLALSPTLISLIGLGVLLTIGWAAFRYYQRFNEPRSPSEIFARIKSYAVFYGYPAEESETITEFGSGIQTYIQKWTVTEKIDIDSGKLTQKLAQLITLHEVDLYSLNGLTESELEQSNRLWLASLPYLQKLARKKRWKNFVTYFFPSLAEEIRLT